MHPDRQRTRLLLLTIVTLLLRKQNGRIQYEYCHFLNKFLRSDDPRQWQIARRMVIESRQIQSMSPERLDHL